MQCLIEIKKIIPEQHTLIMVMLFLFINLKEMNGIMLYFLNNDLNIGMMFIMLDGYIQL